ncbi:MAG: hypothetical protein ACFBSD_06865 [Paracoccaceae bacterium]
MVGLGDHVPAFLLREVKIRKTSAKSAKKTDEVDETDTTGPEIDETGSESKAA